MCKYMHGARAPAMSASETPSHRSPFTPCRPKPLAILHDILQERIVVQERTVLQDPRVKVEHQAIKEQVYFAEILKASYKAY